MISKWPYTIISNYYKKTINIIIILHNFKLTNFYFHFSYSCCQTPDNDPSRKDACCHIKGFAVQPPQWQCDKNHNSGNTSYFTYIEIIVVSIFNRQRNIRLPHFSHSLECVEDVDCRMGGKCHECECHSSPGPEPKPKPIPKSKSTPGPEPTPGPDPDECPEDSG